jgi:NADH-quinone oxidoreductase subunit G
MFGSAMRAYLLLGLEPEVDCADGRAALAALTGAEFVTALTAYRTPTMDAYADVLLPMALFAETSGTYVNMSGEWQSFAAAVAPPGDSRPGWKVLRVLGNLCEVPGFEQVSSEEVREELRAAVTSDRAKDSYVGRLLETLPTAPGEGLELIVEVPMHGLDAVLRRAPALQQTPDAGDTMIHIGAATAEAAGLAAGARAELSQAEARVALAVVIDARVPEGCVMVYGTHASRSGLTTNGPRVTLRRLD